MSSPAGLLHSVLSSARDDLKRTKREGAPVGYAGSGGADGTCGAGAGPTAAGVNARVGSLGELHVSVRKLVKEFVSQTCFEEVDFEKAHVDLLSRMAPGMACNVLRSLRARLTKSKRREHRSPPLFLLGALQTAARNVPSMDNVGKDGAGGAPRHGEVGSGLGGGGGGLGAQDSAEMVEKLRQQIRALGATPDF